MEARSVELLECKEEHFKTFVTGQELETPP
uniref:Uncharacterized protein n=1 Tax=Ciona intestinalis TaxID=7719 RepID=H2XWG6_CIOIN